VIAMRMKVAEREGFEPSERIALNGFRVRCVRLILYCLVVLPSKIERFRGTCLVSSVV